jgi:hypothetical protein
MMRLAMSPAALGLLRALLRRAEVGRDRILLTDWRSTDWQSLTLMGEHHCLGFRIAGPGAQDIADRLTSGIEEAEFTIPGQIVGDIAMISRPWARDDGSVEVCLEALTIEE